MPNLDYELDKDLRQSYRGGFTYLNPIYKEKDVGQTVVLDVNSLYPSCMYYKDIPYGEPVFFEGQYQDDTVYPLYIQQITCDSFKIKKNKIPTIQVKNNRFLKENEYLEEYNTNGKLDPLCLVLTNIDLRLFLEHYEVENLNYVCGWKFKACDFLFKKYIDKWINVKIQATKEKNAGQRQMAKLQLNSLYGKLATSLEIQSKIPYMGEDEIIHYKLSEKEIKNGIYLPARFFYYFLCKRSYN